MINTLSLKKAIFFGAPLFLLAACQGESYPVFDRNELVASCVEGIEVGQTPVVNGHDAAKNKKDAEKLCLFRFQEFTKEVPYSDYKRYKLHIYENFERAYGHKYTLKDIYATLSPNDKEVFKKVSKIMLGLDTNHEK